MEDGTTLDLLLGFQCFLEEVEKDAVEVGNNMLNIKISIKIHY